MARFKVFHAICATILLSLPALAVDICRPATEADVNNMPGIDKLRKAITDDFGAPPVKFYGPDSDPEGVMKSVRDDTRNTRDSQVCASNGPYQMIGDAGTLQCSYHTADYGAAYDGATGFLMLSVTSGYTSTNTFGVTKTSSYGIDVATGFTVKYLKSVEVTTTVTNRWAWSDSVGSEQSQAINQVVSYIATCTGVSGIDCSISMNVSSCFSKASIVIPVALSGWFRMDFDEPQTYAGQGEDSKQKSWWFSPELTYGLTAEDLVSNMIVQGSIQSESRASAYIRGVNSSTEMTTPLPNATGFNTKRSIIPMPLSP